MRFACFTTSSTVKRKRLWLGVRDVKRKYYVRCAQQKVTYNLLRTLTAA